MTIKHIAILLSLIFLPFSINAAPQASPNKEKPHIEKPRPQKSFPRHWGAPPRIQVRDFVKLPGGFGKGSSTLAKWISTNLKRDIDKGKPEKPPEKPTLPERPKKPEPTAEVKEKLQQVREKQREMATVRKRLMDNLRGEQSLELRELLVKNFRTASTEKLQAIKQAQKELQKEIRQTKQDGARRK